MTDYSADNRLKKYCTFSTGGKAARLTVVYTPEELLRAAQEGALVVGRGSNILFGDKGYRGYLAVNRTGEFFFTADTCVAQSGVLLSALARAYRERGRQGLSWAYGLPGSVGGAVVGNAGAFGGSMADALLSVSVWTPHGTRTLSAEDCGFSYRHSDISGTVLSVVLRAPAGDREQICAACDENLRLRREKQPLGASAGSVFAAADGVPAGMLIEKAGLKGLTCGGAEISRKHANFIINRGGAASGDILQLMNTAQAVVFDTFGVKLRREIKLLGEFV